MYLSQIVVWYTATRLLLLPGIAHQPDGIHPVQIHLITAVSVIKKLSLYEFTLWCRDLVSVVCIRESVLWKKNIWEFCWDIGNCPYQRGVRILERCPHWRGVLTERFDCSFRDFRETGSSLTAYPLSELALNVILGLGNHYLVQVKSNYLILNHFYLRLVVSDTE